MTFEQCNDSDTRNLTCPNCGEQFDGELPKWVSGTEECTHCELTFEVEAE